MYAVFSDRGRQQGVRVGDVVTCDVHPDWTSGVQVTFEQVLMITNEGAVQLGTPTVEGASVQAEVIGPTKGKKEVVFRYKRRKNERVKRGHRQKYTSLRITKIDA